MAKKERVSKRPVLFYEDTRTPIDTLTREDILEHYRGRGGRVTYMAGDRDGFTAFTKEYNACVLGSRIFYKPMLVSSLTYKGGRFYGSLMPYTDLICTVFNLNWITDHAWMKKILADRKDLWKSILKGTITNPEGVAKAFSKRYFQGAYSYRNIKEWFNGYNNMSLWDIFYYTTNPDLFLERYMHEEYSGVDIHDLMEMCRYFNAKINPNWSIKRLHAYHQDQIERKNLKKIEAISNEPIAPAYKRGPLELILDERTDYVEGIRMHNCVHSCYWNKIKRGDYLIARGNSNDQYIDCGIRYCDGRLVVDQIHTIYNGTANAANYRYCWAWLEEYREDLERIMAYIKSKWITGHAQECTWEEDIPLPF